MEEILSRETVHPLAFSVKEACKRLSLGRTTFYRLLKSGEITAHKCGRRTIVLWDELERELKSLPSAGRAA